MENFNFKWFFTLQSISPGFIAEVLQWHRSNPPQSPNTRTITVIKNERPALYLNSARQCGMRYGFCE